MSDRTIHQDFATGTGVCPMDNYPASYRMLGSQRFCMNCGDDHETKS